MDAAIGDDLHLVIGQQHVDQHAVVFLGIPTRSMEKTSIAGANRYRPTAGRTTARPRPQTAPARGGGALAVGHRVLDASSVAAEKQRRSSIGDIQT
jgi:hypothetical protein